MLYFFIVPGIMFLYSQPGAGKKRFHACLDKFEYKKAGRRNWECLEKHPEIKSALTEVVLHRAGLQWVFSINTNLSCVELVGRLADRYVQNG
jgi:hypothetical protein